MVSTRSMERSIERTGRRMTRTRRALIDAIGELGDHFTAEQLTDAVSGVGRATVFRNLRLLQDTGMLCQVVLRDGTTEYRVTPGGHHHHIVCSNCGNISDFENCDISDLLAEIARRTGYEIDAHRLEVYGLCAQCSALPSTPPKSLAVMTPA